VSCSVGRNGDEHYMGKRKLRKEVYYALLTIALIIVAIFFAVWINSKGTHKAVAQKGIPVSAVNKTIQAGSQNDSNQVGRASSSTSKTPLDKTVIIDPGHGGPDPGAIGVGGVLEKNLNLIIANKLKDTLIKAGYSIIITREDDRSIYDPGCVTLAEMKDSDLNNRIKIIQDNPHAIFISIHQNVNVNPKYSGTQVYYSLNNPGSITLANMIQSEVKKDLEQNNDRNVQPPGILRVLLKAPSPAVLIECGFISNPAETYNLESGDYQDKLVSTIAKSTEIFFNQNSNS
jgi:N-acetylmuramoyl-L-alanine amidase